MTEWARLERLARIAAAKWSADRDAEDILQECRIAAWQHADEPDAHIVRSCRFRAMDWLKATRGRENGRIRKPDTLMGRGDHASHHTRDPRFESPFTWLARSECWGVSGRLGVIADALAAGYPKQDIAAALEISPGRVSQLIAELRELVA